jgi:hypothetical protein
VLRYISVPCNLALGRRIQQAGNDYTNQLYGGAAPSLLLPPGTDIRDDSCVSGRDVVEVPAASGRWYFVSLVDDVGKGFPNEYRIASIGKACQRIDPVLFPGLFWPTPIP